MSLFIYLFYFILFYYLFIYLLTELWDRIVWLVGTTEKDQPVHLRSCIFLLLALRNVGFWLVWLKVFQDILFRGTDYVVF